jgi:hypothetical protein
VLAFKLHPFRELVGKINHDLHREQSSLFKPGGQTPS